MLIYTNFIVTGGVLFSVIYFSFLRHFISSYLKTKNSILLVIIFLICIISVLFAIHFLVLYLGGRDRLERNPLIPNLYDDLSSHNAPGHEGISISESLLGGTPFDKYSLLPGRSDYLNAKSGFNVTTIGLITEAQSVYQNRLKGEMLDAISNMIDQESNLDYTYRKAAPKKQIETTIRIIENDSSDYSALLRLYEHIRGEPGLEVLKQPNLAFNFGCFTNDENSFLIAALTSSIKSENTIQINELVIYPNYSMEGLEGELIKHFELFASKHGFVEIIATIETKEISIFTQLNYEMTQAIDSKNNLAIMKKQLQI